ncbi:hypothetical protein [Psychrobacter sp. UBA2514]|jgi:hypothetical protein|uniref:hypothetical protein n=1 Tax=Psychrobacter sp. UBA2514 TaxID=1947346 RepID=UPI00257E797E|nr:hypothetical protein [Psychrobacter sp. UBA2514]|tara:strand:+ start:27251 stop:27412 length:162 start_codon:yes stop_codon:yes gene_type:complete
MPNDVYIHPTSAEQRLLERKAAEYGVSVDEFVAWALRQALAETDKELQLIIKH